METKKILACLDVRDGQVVKGQQFQNIRQVADPVELAERYNRDGVDELVLYDISASIEKRTVFLDIVKNIKAVIQVPFTVGGGIRTLEDIQAVLDAGADKVSINSGAIARPEFVKEAAEKFGTERVVFALDAKEIEPGKWNVFAKGGQTDTGMDAIEWAKQAAANGAGEIVVNAIDDDGEKSGYNLPLTKQIAETTGIPVVASGGAGKPEHFKEILTDGRAASALAASVFHFEEIKIPELKAYLEQENVPVRRESN
jgi:cyclase